ncbi:MAG TPA: nucleotidyl transferase AbiEii/AbiGii toxin family protein, partial [archaeon]|nr:nucleotidyl transferase AbiEii/AbiGii toxin family protein [archaeon]
TLQKELGYLGISCRTAKQRRTANMLFLSLALSFPSHPREVPIQVELLKTEPKRSETLALHSPYPDIPPIELRVLAPEELLANKVSAILGREKPRDVHDLFLLLRRGTAIDPALIRQKAPRFSLAILEARLERKRKDWRSLEPLVIGKLPLFEEERSSILRAFALLPRS